MKNKILFIIFLPLLFALITECFFNQFPYFFGRNPQSEMKIHYENLNQHQGALTVKDKKQPGKIVVDFEKPEYIQYFSFDSQNLSGIQTEDLIYQVWKNEDTEDLYGRLEAAEWDHRSYFGRVQTVPIKAKVSKITFAVTDRSESSNLKFSFGDFQPKALLQFNPLRFLLVLFTVYFVLLAILNYKNIIHLKLEYMALCSMLFLGGLYAYFTPPHFTYDEFPHVIRAYNLARGNFFYKQDEMLPYPKDLAKLQVNANLEYQSLADYKAIKAEYDTKKVDDITMQTMNSTAAVYTGIPYIPSGIGMKIGMIFNTSILTMLRLARFMNVLFYAILGFWAIKLVPIRKKFFYMFLLLPVSLFISTNLSCDFMINACVILAAALIIKYKYESKPIKIYQYLLLLFILGLIPFAKTPYAMLLLLLLLLDKSVLPKGISPVKNWCISMIAALGTFVVSYLYGNQFELNAWRIPNVDPQEQLSFILHHPINYVVNTFEFLLNDFFRLFIHTPFGAFAYIESQMGEFWTLITMVILLLLVLKSPLVNPEGKSLLNLPQKLSCLFSIGTSFGLAYTALYMTFTAIGAKSANGFQGRYILPLLFVAIAFLSFKNIKINFDGKKLALASNALILITNLMILYLIYFGFYM